MPSKSRVTRQKKIPTRAVAAKPTRKPARKTAVKKKAKALARVAPQATNKAGSAAVQTPRRAVFIDVENTSSEAELLRVLDELAIDIKNGATQVAAIGNWRMVAQQLGRSLAQRGAQLVHSAPATRVPDWSDLWIAVQAGIWLGQSRPGDVIEIVSHDRAFDAVGDAAAQLGVVFRRITYRSAGAATVDASGERPSAGRGGGRRRRGGGRGATTESQPTQMARPPRAPAMSRPAPAPPRGARESQDAAPLAEESPHGASPQQLHAIIARLVAGSASRTVTLDALTVALKAAGFQRPPGSPRLVTRLRQVAGVEVLANGKLRLTDDAALASALDEAPIEGLSPSPDDNAPSLEGERTRRPRRRGRRGGRSRTVVDSSV